MALSTPASGIKLGGGLRPPFDTSPQERLRGQGPRSNESGEAARSSNLWRDGLRRLRKNRLAMAGGVVILLLCLVAVFPGVLAPLPYTQTNFGRLNEAPSREVPLGTDQVGRDLLSRMISGPRVYVLAGLGAQISLGLSRGPGGA